MIYPILVPSESHREWSHPPWFRRKGLWFCFELGKGFVVSSKKSLGVAVAAALRPKPAGNSQRWRRKGGRNVRTLGQPKWTVLWSKMWEIPWIMALSMNLSNFSTMEWGDIYITTGTKVHRRPWHFVSFNVLRHCLKYNVTGVFTCIHFVLALTGVVTG